MRQGDLFPPPPPRAVGPRANILVGTCSWADPALIKTGTFYPKGSTPESRLRHYATQFPVVEIDSSFFAMPTVQNTALWTERTPAAFRFSIKAYRVLTGHQAAPATFPPDLQPLLPPLQGRRKNHYYADLPDEIRDELWRRFAEALVPLKDSKKLLAVHFQFAPWVTAAPEWIEHIEHCVARMAGQRVAVEFRNSSWLAETRAAHTLQWLRELAAAHTVVDEPQGVGNYAHGVWDLADPALAIVRLHGRNAETWNRKGLSSSAERFNYEYSDAELDELSTRVLELAQRAFTVVVLVNVNHGDQGVRAARRIQAMLAAKGATLGA